jgi:alpha-mannosidase
LRTVFSDEIQNLTIMSKSVNKKNRTISRRNFVTLTASGTAAIAVSPVSNLFPPKSNEPESWPAEATAYRFHMIGHAHIDPVWLWPWNEGISVVHSTFRSALDRMKESNEVTFVSSSAQFYQWVSENDPEMLQEIRKRVDEGRWNIAGGWWVEPDVNIPCGEAMVRQGLYGQLTLQKLLGRKAKVAFNPDSFGHTGTLPQIIRLQGMENYVFMRPGPNEKNLPADLFWWEGPDGSRVLAYRIQISYNDSGPVKARIEKIMSDSANQPMKTFMAFYGAGDHGGGATKENMKSIDELKSEKGAPTIFYSTPERYFNEIRENMNLTLPLVKDDLQHHAAGCYTAESSIKKGNRQAETALIKAEKISAIGLKSWGCRYPAEELTEAWKRVLFLQFHDSLAGSSLYEHSKTASEGYGFAMDTAAKVMFMALQKLEWQIPAEDPASQYIVVFNPHAWEVTGNIEYDFNWGTNHKSSRVEDATGNPLPHQWTSASTETGSRKKLVIRTSVPPMGYRQIRLLDGESEPIAGKVTANGNILENEYMKVEIGQDGSLSLFDKKTGTEVFDKKGGCGALIIEDKSDTWSHDIKTFSDQTGKFEDCTVKILENGPLRATIRATSTFGKSTLTIDWSLTADSDRLEASVNLDWKEHLKMLKLSFPVNTVSPAATYEIPYGFIQRAVNGNEDPGQRWIDVTGNTNGKTFGLTVMNDAKYGYSVHDNDLRVTVARSAVYAHHNPRVLDMAAEHMWMDQGIQTFRILLVPHQGTWKEKNIPAIAEEFSSECVPVYQGIHTGTLPKSGSFLSINSGSVIITAVKLSEENQDTIIRCVETNGQSANALLDVKFAGAKWEGVFKPAEIKTLRVQNKTGKITEVNLLEE